jgi:hypothetical protein
VSSVQPCCSSTRSESSIALRLLCDQPARAEDTSALKRRAGLGGHSRPEYPARN